MPLGVLRRVPTVPRDWEQRVREHDYRRSVAVALQMEAWVLSQDARRAQTSWASVTRDGKADEVRTAYQRWVMAPLERPYMRLAAASYSDTMRWVIGQLKSQDPCAMAGPSFDLAAFERIPRWNVLGRVAIPSTSRAWRLAGRAALDEELTGKILVARALRAAELGRAWPRELPGLQSSVCSEVRWDYQASEDSMSIAASKDPFGEAASGLPLRFRTSASTPAKAGR